MTTYTHSLTFGELTRRASTVPDGDYIEMYFFILKSTQGVLRIHAPQKCRIKLDQGKYSKSLVFNYLTKAGRWSSKHSYYTKNNSFYFKTLKEAEDAFKIEVQNAKEVFTKRINIATMSLNELSNY